jgi:hydrogenase/urease accessory protein HupE
MQRLLVAVAVIAVCSLTTSPALYAHSFDPAVVDVREIVPGTFALRWQLPAGGDAMPGETPLELPAHCTVLQRTDGRISQIDCGTRGLRSQRLALSPLAIHSDLLLRLRFESGDAVSAVLTRGAPTFVVPGRAVAFDSGSVLSVARGYLWLGIEHILLGYDHLLFVLALMLLVTDWRRLIATLTAFTLAHSLTLALAILDLVHVAPAPVEASIALSIVLLAAELTRADENPPTLTRRAPWLVAFLFGLLHGLGFAGALRDFGLPPGQVPLALLAFNGGVEVGQLTFVAVACLPVVIWRRVATARPRLGLLPAYAIGSLAFAWLLERVDLIAR